MIIDCCLWAGEWEMLRLRALTLRGYIDRIVVVCCARTHQGQPVERGPVEQAFLLALEDLNVRAQLVWCVPSNVMRRNGRLYERGADERGGVGTPWYQQIERQHRDYCVQAAATVTQNPASIIMVSDVDEIPHPNAVQQAARYFTAREESRAGRVTLVRADWLTLEQRFHSTALNLLHPQQPWYGTCISTMRDIAPQAQRDARTTLDTNDPTCISIPGSGWHFSWMGTDQERQEKLDSFSHAELRGRYDPAAGRRARMHPNDTPLRALTVEESYRLDWPRPILDESFHLPPHWLTEDAWTADA